MTVLICPQGPPPLHADTERGLCAGHQHPAQGVCHLHQADADRQLFGTRSGRLVSFCPKQTFTFTFTVTHLDIIASIDNYA